jgi:hypothetical protein
VRNGGVSCGNLAIDVRQLSAGILQEEFALDGVDSGKEIGKNGGQPCEDAAAILMKENVFVGDEKFQFTHQPEAGRKENGEG